MKKITIDGVLIVEGKGDVSYLSSFVDALFFTTNGYDVSEDKIAFLKEAAKVSKVIIYTDPDDAGEKIRNKLKSEICGVFEAKSEAIIRKFHKKNGVAELEKEEVIKTLKPFMTGTKTVRYNYGLSTLVSLSNNPAETRDRIIRQYRLIRGNNNSLENQLNILKINPKDLEAFIHGN